VILIFNWMQRRFQQLRNRFLQGSWIHLFHNFLNCHSGEVATAIVYESEGKQKVRVFACLFYISLKVILLRCILYDYFAWQGVSWQQKLRFLQKAVVSLSLSLSLLYLSSTLTLQHLTFLCDLEARPSK
jgi:hypothetical protein